MSAEFSFSQRVEQNSAPIVKLNLTNHSACKSVIEAYKHSLPKGMLMYISGNLFGVSYKHPKNAPGYKTSDWVILDQPYDNFSKQANHMCDLIYKMAKRMEKKYPDQKQTNKEII
jgi:hypothetical protein